MISKNKRCLNALDRAAGLWREDDMEGALKVLDEALAECPSHALLRMQKYFMEKAKEYKAGVKRIDMPPHNPGDPKISIVMTTYKRNTWIRESIESVLKQTFSDLELIVVNDGGIAETEEIVTGFGDSRIRYVWMEHGGRAPALNVGLAHARGNYIAFLDDDDIYYPEHMSNLIAALQTDAGALASYSHYMVAFQTRRGDRCIIRNKKEGKIKELRTDSLILRNVMPINSLLIKREGFLACGGFNECLTNALDRDMWIRLTGQGDFIRVPGATCEIRVREDGSNITTDRSCIQTHFSNIVITIHKGLLFENKTLSVWGADRAVRALTLLLDSDPDIIDSIDLRQFFKVTKPYAYLTRQAAKGAFRGNRQTERAALKAAVKAAPYEPKLWYRLLTGVPQKWLEEIYKRKTE